MKKRIYRRARRHIRSLPKRSRGHIIVLLAFALIFASLPQSAEAAAPAVFEPVGFLPTVTERTSVGQVWQDTSLPEVAAKPRPAKYALNVTVTAYSSTVDQTDSDPFTTANGTKVRDGIMAWNGVPFGTQVRFPGFFNDKVFVVTDRLNARATHYHMDIWMPTREEAIQWGARHIRAEIL